MSIQSIAIIGAGTMGNGIAQVFASYGYRIVLYDLEEKYLQKGMDIIESSLDRLIKSEELKAIDKQHILVNITTVTNLQEMANIDLIVEAVTEKLEVKSKLFKELDSVCKPETLFASNTSSISITHLAAQTKRPDKVIGMHFMNPVPLMKLVEIIRGLQTSDEVHSLIMELSRKIEKVPVECNDSPGFISNRILMPMINEAIYTLHQGVATAEAIDEVMVLGMAHPMGPLALADLIGLDTCLSIMEVLQKGFNDSKYCPCPLLIRMVSEGYLGIKTGKGFYSYDVNLS